MKKFKQFLNESNKEEQTPEELSWGKGATGTQLGREYFDGNNLTADQALLIGGLYMTPPNKERIKA